MTEWQATSGPEAATRRAAMLRRLRDHFDSEAVLEVDTPALSSAAASDVQIESLEVRSALSDAPLFLHTSPEFCMKRLLASGYPDIYSISRVFRDGEIGRRHQPEFTLVEWYRRSYRLDDIIADTLRAIAAALDTPALMSDAIVIDYRDVFIDALDIDPLAATIAELAKAADANTNLRASLGDDRDAWLDLLLSIRIAPTFRKDRITVVRHYPASQAALAQICPHDASVADRFEVFVGPLEIANGYVELTDAEMQSNRIAEDQARRKLLGRRVRSHDELLVAALRAGLPQCAGVAMGLERLQMVHDRTDNIRDVIPFLFEDRNE